jgi:NADH pyrophosphatase NudC (nudix superfamily)
VTSREDRFCPSCGGPLTTREDGGRARKACADAGCGRVLYDNPTPVVAAIVERDGAVVLARAKNFPETWFGLVTGFLEHGEDPREGVLREVKEELGLDGEIVELVGVYPFSPMNQVIVAYHVRASGEIALGEELAAFKLVPVEKLRPWPFGTGEAVKEWLARRRR